MNLSLVCFGSFLAAGTCCQGQHYFPAAGTLADDGFDLVSQHWILA
jgi:hypothetical protein